MTGHNDLAIFTDGRIAGLKEAAEIVRKYPLGRLEGWPSSLEWLANEILEGIEE